MRDRLHTGKMGRFIDMKPALVPGECCYVSSSRVALTRKTAELAVRASWTEVTRLVEDVPEWLRKDSVCLASSARIRAKLRWTDSFAFEESMTETLDWIGRNAAAVQEAACDHRHRP
jgi:dTDP-D-glucose 4,6-dehydratase